MEYKLFDDYITLQALFKTLGIIQSGGAIKGFLAEHSVLLNGEDEKRRGKKIRINDCLKLPDQNLTIKIIAPNPEDLQKYQEEKDEKLRVAKRVKEMNQNVKKQTAHTPPKSRKKEPVRFPGT